MQNWNVNDTNIAINGFDVVSCWKGNPTPGQTNHCCTYGGCDWHFCTEANKNEFESNPTKWIPQFGGYCCWNVSEGKSCTVDPHCYTVSDNKLYLFCDDNAKSQWVSNCTTCCQTAESNWSKGQLMAA